MTSAQSRQPRLSGNKIVYFLFILLFSISISSCDLFKPVQKPDDKNDNTELDPVIGKNKKPKQSKDIVLKPEDVEVVDWKKPKNGEVPPPITDGTTTIDTSTNNNNNTDPVIDTAGTLVVNPGVLKGSYNISVLMPFFTDRVDPTATSIPAESERSLRFYEGILLGIRQLQAETHDLNISVHDTRRDPSVVSGLLTNSDVANADLVIGPVDADAVRVVSGFAKEYQVPVVSLNSSESIGRENSYYIQSSPSFTTHAQAITKFINQRFAGKNVVMVARSNNSEISRFSTFDQANAMYSTTGGSFKQYVVQGDSKSYSTTDLKDYLVEGDTSIVIIPSWNEGFVSSVMRDLSIIRRRYPVVVVGMPLWDRFDKIDVDYFENLNLHISSSTHIDKKADDVKIFRQNFFDEYGVVPTEEAYKGYDFIVYFSRMLKNHGTGFLNFLEQNPQRMMHTNLSFEPVFSPSSTDGNFILDRFENKQVYILHFENYQFVKVAEGSPTITSGN